ncbi:MFS transporter [Clostridium cibarium]|uniref:MFS transporter n=1 Tax=Clostridium cibarium TaxID=2762247 RepID=A0ABR8PR38_9CLOT|nr:MFS transporter [Clostridium cibarium]
MIKNKKNILIIIIYLAFISLGIPDGVLGVAWPSIRIDMNLPLESIGILTTLLLCNSFISSIMNGRLLKIFGTGGIVFFSCLLTGLSLLGYSFSSNFVWLIICTIPLGLGQGAVDSTLNYYVARNYTSRHMNWLHCFWGIGATLGPFIMTYSITNINTWQIGYIIISGIQLSISILLLISDLLGLWKIEPRTLNQEKEQEEKLKVKGLFSKDVQFLAVILFFLYTGMELSMGTWLNSVLIESRYISIELAGISVTIYYSSIMVGRLISGTIVNKVGNGKMITIGLVMAILGLLFIIFTYSYTCNVIGVIMFGMGLSPVYPCLMHETPIRFSKDVAEKLIGYQVGAACLGGSIISSGIGLLLSKYSLELLFIVLLVILIMFIIINKIICYRFQLLNNDRQ